MRSPTRTSPLSSLAFCWPSVSGSDVRAPKGSTMCREKVYCLLPTNSPRGTAGGRGGAAWRREVDNSQLGDGAYQSGGQKPPEGCELPWVRPHARTFDLGRAHPDSSAPRGYLTDDSRSAAWPQRLNCGCLGERAGTQALPQGAADSLRTLGADRLPRSPIISAHENRSASTPPLFKATSGTPRDLSLRYCLTS